MSRADVSTRPVIKQKIWEDNRSQTRVIVCNLVPDNYNITVMYVMQACTILVILVMTCFGIPKHNVPPNLTFLDFWACVDKHSFDPKSYRTYEVKWTNLTASFTSVTSKTGKPKWISNRTW